MDQNTAIILIDPYNEFLHQDGKLYSRISDSLAASNTIDNLYKLLKIARNRKIPIYYCMHQQTHDHVMQGWKHLNSSLEGLKAAKVVEVGSWGVEYYKGTAPDPSNGDVVISNHWNSSSFQSSDLDYQLRQRGIENVIMAGLVANTCLESTARYAYEFGYTLTMLSDCTAGFSQEAKEAAVDLIWPFFAKRVMTVEQWAESLK